MNGKKILISFWLILTFMPFIHSQVFTFPNSALKSHETLEIKKIELKTSETLIYMSIENRIEGGFFCCDKNIYIIYVDGARNRLITSKGIPVCPDTYKFKTIGEKLDFVLSFSPLKTGTECFDLIEDCNENCFSIYGIILDNNLNTKIDEAFTLAENDEPAKALVRLIKIAEEEGNKNNGTEGLIYMNIVNLARITGNDVKAAEWYRKLESSGLPGARVYIKHLNSQGIKY